MRQHGIRSDPEHRLHERRVLGHGHLREPVEPLRRMLKHAAALEIVPVLAVHSSTLSIATGDEAVRVRCNLEEPLPGRGVPVLVRTAGRFDQHRLPLCVRARVVHPLARPDRPARRYAHGRGSSPVARRDPAADPERRLDRGRPARPPGRPHDHDAGRPQPSQPRPARHLRRQPVYTCSSAYIWRWR